MRLRTVPIAPLIAAALGHAQPQFDVASVKPDAECDSRRCGRALGGIVERPVIDKTGLPGRYDIHLEYARTGRSTRYRSLPRDRRSSKRCGSSSA